MTTSVIAQHSLAVTEFGHCAINPNPYRCALIEGPWTKLLYAMVGAIVIFRVDEKIVAWAKYL